MHSFRSALLLTALAPSALVWPIERLHQPASSLIRLAPAEQAVLSRILRPDLGPLFQGQDPIMVTRALQSFRVERLRLGSIQALAVLPTGDALCSPTGNCSFWIIDLQHHRVLLSTIASETYTVDRNTSHSMPDIITATHGSATDSDLTRWQYDGSLYREYACATLDYAAPDGTSSKQPKITSHPCNSEGSDRSR